LFDHNSPPDIANELFEPLKGAGRHVVSIKKVWGVLDFVGDVIMVGLVFFG